MYINILQKLGVRRRVVVEGKPEQSRFLHAVYENHLAAVAPPGRKQVAKGIIRIRKRGVSLSPRRLFKNDDGVFLNLISIRRIIRFRQAVRALMQVRHI